MMIEPERVGDPLATCVGHENLHASIVICGMRQVPCLGCVIAPRALMIRFHVDKHLCAEGCHGCSIEGEQTFECLVCQE
jgi:hypothetical protein